MFRSALLSGGVLSALACTQTTAAETGCKVPLALFEPPPLTVCDAVSAWLR